METDENIPTDLLFHYTTKEAALEYILPAMEIKMGEYSKTNDPKESKHWDFMGSSEGPSRNFPDHYLDGLDEANKFHSIVRTLCLTLDAENLEPSPPIEDRGYGLSRMWAQYAGKHTGVCLGFDSTALEEAIQITVPNFENLIKRRMNYTKLSTLVQNNFNAHFLDIKKIKTIGPEEAVWQHIQNFSDFFFFNKSIDWRDEREFRWVYGNPSSEESFLIPIKNSLKSITLGVDFPRLYVELVKNFCRPLGITLHIVLIHQGVLELIDLTI